MEWKKIRAGLYEGRGKGLFGAYKARIERRNSHKWYWEVARKDGLYGWTLEECGFAKTLAEAKLAVRDYIRGEADEAMVYTWA